jgi:Ni2+-binding GTPase involved in maturation of urease and hydrogenase
VGAGKTTLVRNLLAHLDSREVIAAHLVSITLDAEDLLRAVANAFALPARTLTRPHCWLNSRRICGVWQVSASVPC